jgi:hypothetical protein
VRFHFTLESSDLVELTPQETQAEIGAALSQIGAEGIEIGHLPARDLIAVEFDLDSANEVDARNRVDVAIEPGTGLASLGGGAWEIISAGPC